MGLTEVTSTLTELENRNLEKEPLRNWDHFQRLVVQLTNPARCRGKKRAWHNGVITLEINDNSGYVA
ncbi:hypothetical protein RRG08_013188 [Elysia crispata]|uniref:Uncharacterized protein n=1 Tax=Elysia crispata TaxID=231223 RepID=A0AAE1B4I8_9GAST|nr:hypothetical protein RRG08_013188 [Elysia crispata]